MRAGAQAAAALLLLGLAAGAAGCGREPPRVRRARPPASDSAAARPPVTYQRHPVGSASALRAFQRALGEEHFRLVLKINRLDLAHVRDRDSLAVPYPFPEELACSPFPGELPAAAAVPKLLLVSLRVQAFAAYEAGRQVRWGPTSSGRKDKPTPPGLYHMNWKARERHSTIDEEWLLRWCVNIENSGISLHQYDLPGYPASHSCVRLLAEDAEWLYGWAEQWRLSGDGRSIVRNGTPVVIFGEYGFGRRPPWKRLPEDPRAATVGAEELEGALRELSAEGAAGPTDAATPGVGPAGAAAPAAAPDSAPPPSPPLPPAGDSSLRESPGAGSPPRRTPPAPPGD